MTHNHFTYKELFTFGWEKTRQYYWFLFCAALGGVIISGATMLIPIVGGIVSLFLTIAAVSVTLRIADGHAPAFRDILKPFETYKITWHTFLATLLVILIVFVGLILLILPAIYLATRLKFYIYAILENENLDAVASVKKSMEMTKGKFWKLFGWNILMALFNFAGLLVFGIGLFFTLPISLIAYAHLYRKLSGNPTKNKNHEGRHLADQ